MDKNRMSSITFQQLVIFLTAAKYENFARAAEELHMTTASVSRNISSLEIALGLVLFVRHKQRVRLSNAGEQFFEDLHTMESQLESVLEKCFELQKCQYGVLRIGDCNVASSSLYLLPILEQFEKDCPEVEVTVTRAEPDMLLEGLMEERYDLIFFPTAGRSWSKAEYLSFIPIIPQKPCVVISKKHRLFQKKDLCLDDLVGEQVIAMTKGFYSAYWESVQEVTRTFNFPLEKVRFVDSPHTMAVELLRGQSIAFMDMVFTTVEKESFRYVELSQCDPIWGICLAYVANKKSLNRGKFIQCIKKMMEADRQMLR